MLLSISKCYQILDSLIILSNLIKDNPKQVPFKTSFLIAKNLKELEVVKLEFEKVKESMKDEIMINLLDLNEEEKRNKFNEIWNNPDNINKIYQKSYEEIEINLRLFKEEDLKYIIGITPEMIPALFDIISI